MGNPVAGGDKKLPWPSSYVDYVASLPGVTVVEAPRRVKIGGVEGRQIVVEVPPMHPTVFLKGDTMWIGGGAAGFDLAGTREVIELTVNGKRLLLDYGDSSEHFASPSTPGRCHLPVDPLRPGGLINAGSPRAPSSPPPCTSPACAMLSNWRHRTVTSTADPMNPNQNGAVIP